MKVEISPGELIDKITILEIKSEKINDARKNALVQVELNILNKECNDAIKDSVQVNKLKNESKKVNEKLWVIEDEIRICEKNKDFGPRFIELARSVYMTNDVRAQLKNKINQLLSSDIQEVKSYEDYS